MGTSSSGIGPVGKTPLLPDWALADGETTSEEDSQESAAPEVKSERRPMENTTDDLTGAKSSLTRVFNNRPGSSFKRAAKNYVRKTGGAGNATKSARAGIRAGSAYLGFISSLSANGLHQTLTDYGLSGVIGKPALEVLSKISDQIAPLGSTNDEAIARASVMAAFDKLCERLLSEEDNLDALNNLTEDDIRESVVEYVSIYIFKKWVYELGMAIERNELSASEAVTREEEMRVFVAEETRVAISKISLSNIRFDEGEGKALLESIFNMAYSTLES